MDWLYLALLTPLLWSIVVLIDDNLLHHVYKGPYLGAIISGLFGALPLISLLWLDTQPTTLPVILSATSAGFLTIIYYFFYFRALEKESPSIVIALMSITPLVLPFFAYTFLGEQLTVNQMWGFMIVLGASFLLAVTDVRKFKFSPALIPVTLAAVLYAAVSLAIKYVYENTNFYTGYMYFALGMGLGALFYIYVMLYARQKQVLKGIIHKNNLKILIVLVIAEAVNVSAEFFQGLAISKGPVSLVKAVGNIQPVYMLLIAILLYPFFPKFFREAEDGGIGIKLFLMLVITAGVYVTTI